MRNICRFCLTEDTTLIDIFEASTNLGCSIASAVMACITVQIRQSDFFPKVACKSCYNKVEDTHQFRNLVLKSEKTLCSLKSDYMGSPENICNELDQNDCLKINKSIKIKNDLKYSFVAVDGSSCCNDVEKYSETSQLTSENNVYLSEYTDITDSVSQHYVKVEEDQETKEKMEKWKTSLQCDNCFKNFISAKALSKHKNTTHEGTLSRKNTFSQLVYLKKHENAEQKLPQCDNRKTKDKSDGLKTRRRLAKKTLQCNICNKTFIQSSDLKRHCCLHTGEKPYQCDICGKSFTQSGQLCRHKRLHSGDTPYHCDVCNRSYTTRFNLKMHRCIHTVDEKTFRCDGCSKSFHSINSLNRHKQVHTGRIQCSICNKCFTQRCDLKRHNRLHTGEKPFVCDDCGKCFVTSHNLKNHKRLHTGAGYEKKYQCDICNKCFTSHNTLKVHKRLHTGEKPYQCDFCGKFFNQSGDLHRHKRIHTGEKPHRCQICDKSFIKLVALNIHKRLHTGEKPHQCDVCGARFISSTNLKKHRRNAHAIENPFQCDLCNKRFANLENLSKHKSSHTV